MMLNIKKLEEQEKNILLKAQENGRECDYLFTTAFARYKRQVRTLIALDKSIQEAIDSGETLVTKEYVKGRGNVMIHPAIQQFDKTTDSANKTVATLLRIFKTWGVENSDEEIDPLMDIINGGDAYESQSI